MLGESVTDHYDQYLETGLCKKPSVESNSHGNLGKWDHVFVKIY